MCEFLRVLVTIDDRQLALSDNQFVGTLPTALFQLASLEYGDSDNMALFDARFARLARRSALFLTCHDCLWHPAHIPASTLTVDHNSFSGTIDSSVTNLELLEYGCAGRRIGRCIVLLSGCRCADRLCGVWRVVQGVGLQQQLIGEWRSLISMDRPRPRISHGSTNAYAVPCRRRPETYRTYQPLARTSTSSDGPLYHCFISWMLVVDHTWPLMCVGFCCIYPCAAWT